ncbi:MAG: hypothetical protein IT457_15550, partial [Planctomycetes bacterium]|nr:hypothetical protein [Planctomycetota bacterium]
RSPDLSQRSHASKEHAASCQRRTPDGPRLRVPGPDGTRRSLPLRELGCLAAAQLVPQRIEQIGERHYEALLTAPELHCSSYQRAQLFQVMSATRRWQSQCGAVTVEFGLRKVLERTTPVTRNTPRRPLRMASSEPTVLERVGDADRCGGLGHVLAVRKELGKYGDFALLAADAAIAPRTSSQFLGHMLKLLAVDGAITASLAAQIDERSPAFAPWSRSRSRAGAASDRLWRIVFIVDLEPPSWSPATPSSKGAPMLRGPTPRRSSRTSSSAARLSSCSLTPCSTIAPLQRWRRAAQAVLAAARPMLRGHRSRSGLPGADQRGPRSLPQRARSMARGGPLEADRGRRHTGLPVRLRGGADAAMATGSRDQHARTRRQARRRPDTRPGLR